MREIKNPCYMDGQIRQCDPYSICGRDGDDCNWWGCASGECKHLEKRIAELETECDRLRQFVKDVCPILKDCGDIITACGRYSSGPRAYKAIAQAEEVLKKK